MAYVRPVVMVFQEYAKMSVPTETTTLNPCVVGPCYHIIDSVEDDEISYVGIMAEAGMQDVEFPNNRPGAVVVEDSVRVLVKNPVIELTDTNFVATSMVESVITFADATAFPTNVQKEDFVKVLDGDDADALLLENAIVMDVDAANFKITVSRMVITTSTNLKVILTREVDDIWLEHDSSSLDIDVTFGKVTISPLTVTIGDPGTPCNVIAGYTHISYKALRTDVNNIITLFGIDAIQNTLGKICSENPLALAASIVNSNTTTPVKVFGISSNDMVGYSDAKDALEGVDDVYSIVPLTQNSDYINIFKVHAETMSDPLIGKWRVCIASTPITTIKTLTEGSSITLKENSTGNPNILIDDNANFLTDGVNPGDKISLIIGRTYDNDGLIVDQGTVTTYTVADIILANMLKVVEDVNTTVYGIDATGIEYIIKRNLDKTEQAKEIAATSTSFGSQRMIHVWPSICHIDDIEEPGYYLACTIAGMTSGLPSHQGFTRISVAGVGELKYSNDYFNQTQLDIIAGGGTFVFVQKSQEAPPYVRHQLTTEMSTIEFREFSFVKNYDYISYICKDVLDRFLGKYNANSPSTLAVLETAINSVMESLMLYNLPKIGSPVLNYEVVSVEQLDNIRDRIEMVVNVYLPYALNIIGLHLVSQ